jgi:dephospho-CoA kinase
VPLLAVTGGLAEGKSTVLGELGRLGVSTQSADAIVARLMEDPGVRAQVMRAAGLAEGSGPEALRRAVWTDQDIRRRVNAVLHRPVLKAVRREPAQAVEVPLLVEACLPDEFTWVWVVTCGEEEQRRRLARRWGSAEAAMALRAQLPTRAKAPFADAVLRTNLPRGTVSTHVADLAAAFGLV